MSADASDPREPACHQQPLPERAQWFAGAMIVAFTVAWLSWFTPFDDWLDASGTPVGADFAMFYVAGQVVCDRDSARLYDQANHQQRLHELFPGIDPAYCLPYRYPPFVAVLFAPLSRLSYPAALAVFGGLSALAVFVATRLLWPELQVLRQSGLRPLILVVFGWPVTLEVLIGGQASHFALLIGAAVFVALSRRRVVLAGALLALAAYKPNVLLLAGIGLIVRHPRMLIGALPAGFALIALGAAVSGPERLYDYAVLTKQLSAERWNVDTPWWKVHSLANALAPLLQGRERLVCLVTGAVLSIGVAFRSRCRATQSDCTENIENPPTAIGNSPSACWSHLLVINALFNPYTPIYDLILVGFAAVLLAESRVLISAASQPSAWIFRVESNRRDHIIQMLWVALAFGPHLSQAVAPRIGFQAFPVLLAAGWIGVASWTRHSRG